MADSPLKPRLIEAMSRHLPPAGATLRVLDLHGRAAALAEMRSDLDIVTVGDPPAWAVEPGCADAVTAYDCAPNAALLRAALDALRPGGRLIIASLAGRPGEALVRALESAGYTRILVEAAAETPAPVGVLMRGEKPHPDEAHPADRVRAAIPEEAPRAGHYVYLLVQQSPNKPVWALQPEELVEWSAAAVAGDAETVLVAFSSLPRAVAFMQPAVVSGRVQGVNKIAKYRWDVVRSWPHPVMLNPTDDLVNTNTLIFLPVDPTAAEAPDE
ncbi:MAG: hypothetical protein HXY41_07600 [Chloroflexi bacterium]|nr:hypothetical protein [Chloroflexota bacterium]